MFEPSCGQGFTPKQVEIEQQVRRDEPRLCSTYGVAQAERNPMQGVEGGTVLYAQIPSEPIGLLGDGKCASLPPSTLELLRRT